MSSLCNVRRRKSHLYIRRNFMMIIGEYGIGTFIFSFSVSKMSQFQCLTYSISLIKGIIGWIASLDMDDDCGRVVRGEFNSILWFVSRWMKCDDGFFSYFSSWSSFRSPSEITTVFQFFCVFPSYVIWISLCIMFYADTDKRKTVVVCGGVGDWTMEGKYELTSVIITEDIAHSHTTEEPEKRRKWTFATL